MMPIVSKMYCSPSQVVLVVRRRPHVVYGGGFVVTDCTQKVVFRADGCGILGKDGEVTLRDAEGDSLLLIRRKVHLFLDSHPRKIRAPETYNCSFLFLWFYLLPLQSFLNVLRLLKN